MTDSSAILGYRKFLETRDGTPDAYRDTLSRRESFFRGLDERPVRSKRVFDRATFLRNFASARPEPGLDERMLWLLATAKMNQGERFGVELGKLYRPLPDEDGEPEQLHVLLQESYHTRTLARVVGLFGLPVPLRPPARSLRLFIELMVRGPLPERWVLRLVGLSEMTGCVMFRLMRDKGLELFGDEPEVAERIRLLYDDILADEISHVGLIEARLGRRGNAWMHRLYRALAPHMVRSLSPLLGSERVAGALRAPFDQGQLAAGFPTTAYAF